MGLLGGATRPQGGRLRLAALALLLALAVATSHAPTLRGGFVWDDDSYVTENPHLRSPGGLREIWTSPRSSPQYYPLVFTSFWAEYQLWGLRPLGYHLTNLLLHVANTLLLWWLLRSLAVPGAWLAAAIWGLHPVNVESVAWITERKNVLSGFFYLGALVAFVRPRSAGDAAFDAGGALLPASRGGFLLAFGCSLCALLSKTVTATLPLALALIWWWKGVAFGARRIRALLPLFAAGVALGVLTLWMEKFHVGARGEDWTLTAPERLLVAGRALWFYLGKLVWPADLTFVYPRWDLQAASWTHYLYPATAAGVVAALWWLGARVGRGPLAATLYFILTLAPALGFVDIYPMRFSYVADHFVYLAGIGPVALFAAILDRCFAALLSPVSPGAPEERLPALRGAAAAFVLAPLAFLTWRQGGIYRDLETLWRDTIRKNPAAWIAHNNLGAILVARDSPAAAAGHFLAALEARPDLADAWANLANARLLEGRDEEARRHFLKALALDDRTPLAHLGLGTVLERAGKIGEARAHFEQAVTVQPDSPGNRYRLALFLSRRGEWDAAEEEFTELLRRDPGYPGARLRLADVLAARGRHRAAERQYREALRLEPDSAETHNGLGVALAVRGDLRGASEAFTRAIALKPDFTEARDNLAAALERLRGAASGAGGPPAQPPALGEGRGGGP